MPITPNHLIALAYVARSGSLTAAGEALGKTQPAVSAQLKQLSDVVGMPLVTRHRHGVTLSPAGEALLPYAQACVRALEGAGLTLKRLSGMEAGKLRVLASTSVAVYMLPPALALFHASFPGIELLLGRHNAEDAMQALERGDGDLAVVRGPAAVATLSFASNFVLQVLAEDETMLVVTRKHPLAKHRELAIEQLDGLVIVSRENSSATGALVEQLAARAGVSFCVKFQTVGVEALKEAVLQGFGAGFLSRLAVQRELDTGTLAAIRITAPELTQHITIAYPARGQCPPTVPRFVEILRSLNRPRTAPARSQPARQK